jgi:hypothetical protein
MSVTILEALENAESNLKTFTLENLGAWLARSQVHNAVVLLRKGYLLYDLVEPLLEKYGTVEKVPVKEEETV